METNRVNPLQKKLAKSLTLSLDDLGLQQALETLGQLYPHDSLTSTRKNLQSDIEKRKTNVNRRFLDALTQVNEELIKIEQQVDELDKSSEEMDKRLQDAVTRTSHLIEQTATLKQQIQRSENKRAIAQELLAKFMLTDKELQVLHDSSIVDGSRLGVDTAFFDALKRLQEIHKECRALLVSEHQRAGMEILETMSRQEERAYEKLYRWAQSQSQIMGKDYPEVNGAFRSAMRALRLRPLLFQTIMDDISKVRRNALVRMFLDALTRGGPNGTPRPIEVHAHDPLRYVGDMLSWLHQASMEEREMLQQLFATDKEVENEQEVTGKSLDAMLQEILDENLEGCCRPLKNRVLLQADAIVLLKLGQLMKFYEDKLASVLGERKVTAAIKVMQQDAENAVLSAIRASNAQLANLPQPVDLKPQERILNAIDKLKTIVHAMSMHESGGNVPESAAVLHELADPIVAAIQVSATTLSGLDSQIYLANTLGPLYVRRNRSMSRVANHGQSVLTEYSFTLPKAKEIQQLMEQTESTIAEAEMRSFIAASGLESMFASMETPSAIDAVSLQHAMQKLDEFAAAASFDTSPRLARLTSARLGRQITRTALESFMHIYQRFHALVETDSRLNAVAIRPPAQLKTLFGFE